MGHGKHILLDSRFFLRGVQLGDRFLPQLNNDGADAGGGCCCCAGMRAFDAGRGLLKKWKPLEE